MSSQSDRETLFEEKRHEVESLLGSLTGTDDYCSQGACDTRHNSTQAYILLCFIQFSDPSS